jgi:D-proline reductase (dithiol) PrdB
MSDIRFEPVDPDELEDKWESWLALVEGTHHGVNHRVNPDAAFTPLRKPLSESRIALLSTAGVHLDDQEPFHTETVAGDQTIRLIPDDVDLSRLRFSHTHYDTSSAERDPNVVFPLDRLHELVAEGRLGSTAPFHVGMMGFNPDPTRVAEDAAPEVVRHFREMEVDVALMVPG